MNYRNILFDLDGTLTDPKEGITKSVAYALESFGIEVENPDSLTPFIGPPLTVSFAEYYGFDSQKCLEAVRVYREYFTDRGIFENRVYDGIIPLLNKLKARGFRLFIATSKPQPFAERIAEKFGFAEPFESICGIPLDGEGMSKSQVIDSLMNRFLLEKEQTVMVGDRAYDAVGARDNGIDCIGVLYGYGGKKELEDAGVTRTVGSVKELGALFGIGGL